MKIFESYSQNLNSADLEVMDVGEESFLPEGTMNIPLN